MEMTKTRLNLESHYILDFGKLLSWAKQGSLHKQGRIRGLKSVHLPFTLILWTPSDHMRTAGLQQRRCFHHQTECRVNWESLLGNETCFWGRFIFLHIYWDWESSKCLKSQARNVWTRTHVSFVMASASLQALLGTGKLRQYLS